jgi:hypothetical protein
MTNNHMDQTRTVVFDSNFIDCISNGLQPVTFAAAADDDDNDALSQILVIISRFPVKER